MEKIVNFFDTKAQESQGTVVSTDEDLFVQQHLYTGKHLYKKTKDGQQKDVHSFEISHKLEYAKDILKSTQANNFVIKTPDKTIEAKIVGNEVRGEKTIVTIASLKAVRATLEASDLVDGQSYEMRILSPSNDSELGMPLGGTFEFALETATEASELKRQNVTFIKRMKPRNLDFSFKSVNVSNPGLLSLFWSAEVVDDSKDGNPVKKVGISSQPNNASSDRYFRFAFIRENSEGKKVLHYVHKAQISGESFGESVEDYLAISYKVNAFADGMYPAEINQGEIIVEQ